jgi:Kef-type K+ transport system membrane component KefB
MDRFISKNPAFIGTIMVVVSVLTGLVIGFILELLDLDFNSSSFIAGVVSATIVGQIYTGKYREVMPKNLAKQASLVYILIESVFAVLFFLYVGYLVENPGVIAVGVIGFALIIYFLFPWLIRKGGENYLKAIEKNEAKQSSKKE